MMLRVSTWLAAGIAFVLVVCTVDSAHADARSRKRASRKTDAAAAAEKNDAEKADKDAPPGYVEVLRDAIAESDAQNWPEAKALFEKAHAMYPNARTLRGLGLVAFAARRYVDARTYLSEALTHPMRPMTDAQRAQVQDVMAQCETFLGHFKVAVSPADAQLLVDGLTPQLDDAGLVLLDPGSHELVVSAPAYLEIARKLDVTGGERGEVTIELQSIESTQPKTVIVNMPTTPTTPVAKPRLWTWVALGSAAVFGGAALAAYLSGNAERDDIDAECKGMPGGGCSAATKESLVADSDIALKGTLATVGVALSATAVVGAGVLFFVEGRPSRDDKATKVAIGLTGLTVSRRF